MELCYIREVCTILYPLRLGFERIESIVTRCARYSSLTLYLYEIEGYDGDATDG